ncbi:MAG: dihydrolipoyl dehydrogenase, partial [Ruminococcaceae bacterium]|nr:dihydrolipoyl dehydrogenase [Oscillospiraceae bacterium]
EEKAKEKGYETVCGIFTSVGNGKSLVVNETRGFVKVVADKKTHEILGLRLFCAHATDMIGEGIAAIKLESTLEELGDAIHPHPTVNEMIMEAVHDALGHCAHKVYKKKK